MVSVANVISKPKYLLLTTLTTLILLAFAAWLPNLHLITQTMTSSTMTVWQKTNLVTSLLGSLKTNFTLLSLFVTITSSALTGILVSLFIYYIKRAIKIQQTLGASFAGIVFSLFGVGCASCGSVVLTSFIGLGTTTAIVGMLPFRGQEFGLLGIAITMFAITVVLKKINDPAICGVRRKA